MINFYSKVLLILLISLSYSTSEEIERIEIDGNKRITNETIQVLADIKIGDDLDDKQLNNSLKKLYQTNFFEKIDLNLNQNKLKITVIENPIIENINIQGIKNKSLNELLLEQMSLKNRMSFNDVQFQNDINLIQNILKSYGYYFSKIKTFKETNKELNSVQLDLIISLGEKAKIKKIDFIGNKSIKDKQLLEIIASEEHKFWKFLSKNVYINQSLINLDKRLLENYYKNLGYYDVEILNSFAEYSNDGFFKLVFNIDSGLKYKFNNLNLILPDDYDKSDFEKIIKIFDNLKGEFYSLDSINLILDEIDKIASLKLYDFIDAEVEENIKDDKLDLVFRVKSSESFYVERINVIGNYNTIEEVIRNELIIDEGDPLNNLLLNKSIDEIKSLNIFKKVDYAINKGSTDNTKNIDIIIEERPTGEISLAAGVGTSGTTIGGGIVEKNFLGKGIRLNTNFTISEEALEGKFIYSKPNFAYTDNTLFTSFSSSTADFLTDFGYKMDKTQFSFATEYEQFENLFFKPQLEISLEDLTTNSSASNTLKKQQGNYEDLYFNYGFTYDLRNSKFRPSSGTRTTFFQELPLVSENAEMENTFSMTKYKMLNKSNETIGKASLYLKTINSINNKDVRISKRVNVPSNRLRGFEKGKIGPKDNNDYIGGNYVSAINLSTNLPFVLNTLENMEFTYFIDAANVWGVDYDDSIDERNGLRSSTGIAVDFLTPIGPLSFSFTQPITKESTDKTETFRFNLGTTF